MDYLSLQQERYRLQIERADHFTEAYVACDSVVTLQSEIIRKYKDLYVIQEANIRFKDIQTLSLEQNIKNLQKDLILSEKKLTFVYVTAATALTAVIVYFLTN